MASSKTTDLTADASPTVDDLVPTVHDPAGTPANRKVALGALPVSTPQQTAIDDAITDLDEIAAGVRTDLDTSTPGFVGIDVDLTEGKAGGDTLVGGTASGDDLTLASTSHATRGLVVVRDPMQFLGEDFTHTSATDPVVGMEVPLARTVTLNDTGGGFNLGNSINALIFRPTVIFESDGNLLLSGSLFYAAAVFQNASTEVRTASTVAIFNDGVTYRGTGAAGSFTVGAHIGFRDAPTVEGTSSGTGVVTSLTSFVAGAAAGSGGTITTRRGLHVNDSSGAGAVTTGIGVDIDAMSDATTSIGLRNASTTVLTPLANTNITAVSATIRRDASIVTLTANASYTLTSTPTIADGQNGQVLRIVNVDTVDTITLQDQGTLASSNLRLSAATVALGPRDSIELVFLSTVGDWVQTSQVNVV